MVQRVMTRANLQELSRRNQDLKSWKKSSEWKKEKGEKNTRDDLEKRKKKKIRIETSKDKEFLLKKMKMMR